MRIPKLPSVPELAAGSAATWTLPMVTGTPLWVGRVTPLSACAKQACTRLLRASAKSPATTALERWIATSELTASAARPCPLENVGEETSTPPECSPTPIPMQR
jgi:hypothetical protein